MKQERAQDTQQKQDVRKQVAKFPGGARDHGGYDRDDDDIPGQRQTPIQASQQNHGAGNEGTGHDDNIGNLQHTDQTRRAESRDGNRADREQKAQQHRQPTEAEQTREDIQRAEEEGMLKHKTENEPRHKASSDQRGSKSAPGSGRPLKSQDRNAPKQRHGKSSSRH